MSLTPRLGQSGQIFTVSALTELIRDKLESSFPFVWVKGEVTDYKISSKGHMYFSLKDDNSLLQCVWFYGSRKQFESQNFDPLTGEVFDEPRPDMEKVMRNGLELACAGGVNLYAPSGRYQLAVEYAELTGEGALAAALERRKAKYQALGYFSIERKRPLPASPLRVALITSPQGAAIHDFLKLAALRGLSSRIRLFPVTVQGKGAALKMAQAIEEANRQDWAELIVLIRGGGSTEDLMEFNEPVLVEAIFNSRLPVLAGIGHEVDTFLADLTADVRAATPSHAAQILWPLRRDIRQRLDILDDALDKRFKNRLSRFEELVSQKARELGWLSPTRKLERAASRLGELDSRLAAQTRGLIYKNETLLGQVQTKLRRPALMDKLQLLAERLLWSGRASLAAAESLINARSGKLADYSSKLESAANQKLDKSGRDLEKLNILLQHRDPMAPLKKGYALLSDAKGVIRSAAECRPGQALEARLSDGTLELTVRSVHKNGDPSHA